MSKIHLTALLTFGGSHLFLILALLFDNSTNDTSWLMYAAWILGVVSVISNVILADELKTRSWVIAIFGIVGIIWFFPMLLASLLGIPFAFIFFLIGVYIQIKATSKNLE